MDNVTFDFSKIKAREFNAIVELADKPISRIVDEAAEFLARVVTACPAEWGSPSDPETYRDLDVKTYVQVFREALKSFLAYIMG